MFYVLDIFSFHFILIYFILFIDLTSYFNSNVLFFPHSFSYYFIFISIFI